MAGISNLKILLKDMDPVLCATEYVFCTVKSGFTEKVISLNPVGTFREKEGLTLILEKGIAIQNGYTVRGVYKKITLNVHSDLEAVGLTAAFSKALGEHNISANVIAGFYHDHIFVPEAHAKKAQQVLINLAKENG